AILEAVFGSELASIGVGDELALGDADQRVMRFMVVASGKEGLIGGHEREHALVGKGDEMRLGKPFGGGAVALQLDVETIAETLRQRLAARRSEILLARCDGTIERP